MCNKIFCIRLLDIIISKFPPVFLFSMLFDFFMIEIDFISGFALGTLVFYQMYHVIPIRIVIFAENIIIHGI